MRAAFLSLVLCAAALVPAALVPDAHAATAPVTSVSALDLQRYAGTWHEQARLPLFFQRNCTGRVTATYRVRDDGLIDVVNACDTAKGRISQAGVARRPGAAPARLEVRFAPAALSFLPMVWADYWVLALDPDYRWSLVGTPDRKYLWLLTRDADFPAAEREQVLARARAMGFDLGPLILSNAP